MKREEAIRMLIRIKDRINFEVTDSQKKMDALNMAIHALDVLMAQADVTDDDIETMRILFNADIECLCNQGRFNDAKEMEQIRDRLKARLQADGEYKSNKELLCDSCYRKIAGCQAKFHNPHPVDHCIEYKPIEKQADGEYISREAVIDIIEDVCPIYENDYRYILREKVNELPSVDIPPEHDGCKDCRWQSQSETEMPCKQCKHNYTDEWERAKIRHWVETGRMFVEPNDDQILYEYICDSCKGLAYFRKSMDDLVGAKYCPCCNSHMEIER